MSAEPVPVRDPEVAELVGLLTAELADGGYGEDETFGYPLEKLESSGVRLVGVRRDGRLVGLGGLETDGGTAELKRFYVRPEHRGSGVADEIVTALLDGARAAGVTTVRLETGDKQHAAMAFYRRHGFRDVERFGPYVDSATSVCMERSL